jgi:hypothetical protein
VCAILHGSANSLHHECGNIRGLPPLQSPSLFIFYHMAFDDAESLSLFNHNTIS